MMTNKENVKLGKNKLNVRLCGLSVDSYLVASLHFVDVVHFLWIDSVCSL